MNPFFNENDAGRLEALLAASEAHPQKLPAYIIEKDFYVTCILQILYLELALKFTSICPAPFIFKGGTSLSKCHSLISRMSEDIDLSFSMDFHLGKRKFSVIQNEDVERCKRRLRLLMIKPEAL